jgi:hypothetical protein
VTEPIPGATAAVPLVIDASDLSSPVDDSGVIAAPDSVGSMWGSEPTATAGSSTPPETGSEPERNWSSDPTAISPVTAAMPAAAAIPEMDAGRGPTSTADLGGASVDGTEKAPNSSPDDKGHSRSKRTKVLIGAGVVGVVIIGVIAAVALGGHSTPKAIAPVGVKRVVVRPVAKTPTTSSTSTTSTTSAPFGQGAWTYPTPIVAASASDDSDNTVRGLSCVAGYTCWAVDSGGNI